MSVYIKLLEPMSQTIHFQGKGQILHKENGFELMFSDEKYAYSWKVYPQGCMIHSKSELDVFLTCKENHKTQGHIDSEYGRIDLLCYTKKYEVRENEVEIEYDLIQDGHIQSFHFVLYIEEDASHVH